MVYVRLTTDGVWGGVYPYPTIIPPAGYYAGLLGRVGVAMGSLGGGAGGGIRLGHNVSTSMDNNVVRTVT